MLKKFALFALCTGAACLAGERATYDSAGRLTSLISSGVELPVRGDFRVRFTGAPEVSAQPDDQRSPIAREGLELKWQGAVAFPNGSQAQVAAAWAESDSGVALRGSLTPKSPFPGRAFRFPVDVESADYVIDLPRAQFAGWHLEPSGAPLPETKPADPRFFSETTQSVSFADARGNWRLSIALDQPRPVTVTDVWDSTGRSYRVRVSLLSGPWMMGDSRELGLTLRLSGTPATAAANLSVDPAAALYPFDGFGGNYRVYADTPVADYTLKTLRLAWARFEFKAIAWDHDRAAAEPSPQLKRDFELMQQVQRMGVPWILSLWFLPERFYTDSNQKPFGAFARQIAPERWQEFLDLLGGYLAYLKAHYGAEPDLFSFNESDLGVNIGFTAATHRDEIVRIGAHLASLGLRTKMHLGDTPRRDCAHRRAPRLARLEDEDAPRRHGESPRLAQVRAGRRGRPGGDALRGRGLGPQLGGRHPGAVRGVGRRGRMAAPAAARRRGRGGPGGVQERDLSQLLLRIEGGRAVPGPAALREAAGADLLAVHGGLRPGPCRGRQCDRADAPVLADEAVREPVAGKERGRGDLQRPARRAA